jgi:hypothetical protein
MGHYGLLQVPDLLTGSFALRPDEVFIVADHIFAMAEPCIHDFFGATEPFFHDFFKTLKPSPIKLFALTDTFMNALEFSVHFP